MRKISLGILVFVMSVVPLLIRIIKVNYTIGDYSWLVNQVDFYDVYSKIKSDAIVLVGLLSLILLGIKFSKKDAISNLRKSPDLYAVILILIFILSAVFSVNKYSTIHGYIERYESIFVLLSYLLIFLLVSKTEWETKHLKKIIFFFTISNLFLSVIGIFQYFGINLLINPITGKLITAFNLIGQDLEYSKNIYKNVIYQTLYHSNYVGLYISLSLPIFLTLSIYEKNNRARMLYILTFALVVFNLMGTISRGAMIGIAFSMPLFLFLNYKVIKKYKKAFIAFVVIVMVLIMGTEIASGGLMTKRFKQIFTDTQAIYPINSIKITDNNVNISYKDVDFRVEILNHQEGNWRLKSYLDNQELIPSERDEKGHWHFAEEALQTFEVYIQAGPQNELNLIVQIDKVPWIFSYLGDELKYRNAFGKYDDIVTPKIFGSEDQVRLGSARGYIWSRTIPLILDRPLLGYGPETYPFVFPQNDYVGKMQAYRTNNMVVDKPHNFYLQLAMSSGLLALVAFGGLIFSFFRLIVKVTQLQSQKMLEDESYEWILLKALTVSIFAFLITAMFTDSNVNVSPVFWCILGLAYSIGLTTRQSELN